MAVFTNGDGIEGRQLVDGDVVGRMPAGRQQSTEAKKGYVSSQRLGYVRHRVRETAREKKVFIDKAKG